MHPAVPASAPPAGADSPIDAVITWVDGQDPAHRTKLEAYLQTLGRRPAAAAPTRFRSLGELDYCVASLLRFAPFLRHIHVVTDAQVPPLFERARGWPQALREKLVRVDHQVLFEGHEDCRPSFNSRSIESLLHRIPGLAEHFVYLNDDFVLIRPVRPQDWFREGWPVVRGPWRLAPEKRLRRRLRAWWERRGGRPAPDRRPSYLDAQALAARLAGFEQRYLEHDHHPHPLRRSTLTRYFEAHPQVLRQNIEPRLRDARQFLPQMLAGHLEIRAGTVWLQPEAQSMNIKADALTPAKLARRLRAAERDEDVLSVCIQSLDEATPEVQAQITAWLDRIVGPMP